MTKRSLSTLMLVGPQIGSIGCGNGSTEPGQELDEPCADDHLEPNDSSQEASAVGEHSLVLCPGDQDWFSGTVPLDYFLYFDVLWDSTAGNLSVALIDSDGSSPTLAEDDEWVAEGQIGMVISGPFDGALRVALSDGQSSPTPYSVSSFIEFCCDG